MWQILIFFVVINILSAFITWLECEKTTIRVTAFNRILYLFFGGAVGFGIAAWLLKVKMFKRSVVFIALIENVGVYVFLYFLSQFFK